MNLLALGTPLTRLLGRWRVAAVLPQLNGRVLDVGCGSNRLVREHGCGVGVDVFPWQGVDLVIEDAGRLPFADESFDCVTFLASLNHIPNREQALCEAYRVLRPGGRVLITMLTPLVGRVWHRLMRWRDPDQQVRGMQTGEVWGIADASVRRMLGGAGFVGWRINTFQCGLNRLHQATKAECLPGTSIEHADKRRDRTA